MRMRARDLVKLMTHEFHRTLAAEWDARLGELHMTRHQIDARLDHRSGSAYSPDGRTCPRFITTG